jgi:heterodisulfide reductase subunit C
MASFYEDKKIHADCFSCGACIAACPRDEALMWRGPRRGKHKETKD